MVDMFVALAVAIAVSVAVALCMAVLTLLAWNGSIPYIFGLKTIGYWQAFSLYFLCQMLIQSQISIKKTK